MGQFETYSYDLGGRLTSRRDFNNKVTAFAYDQLNRLLSKTPDASFNQAPITFTYNSLGQRLTMTDATGTTTYSYDNRNRLISKATPQGTLTYTYNAVGNIITVRSSNAEGVSVDYAYDNLNRLQTVTDNNLANGQNQTSYGYDQVGNLQTVILPNQVETTYQYNNLNRLTNVITAKLRTPIASYAYSLGAAGNRLSVSELSGRVVNYTYDSIYRLTSETITGNTNPVLNGSVSYAYDEVGNRLSRTSTLAAVPSQQNIATDANDRLTTDTYDDNGSTVAADGRSYGYDYENRIISVSGNGITITIKYDGDGNRVEKSITQNGQTVTTKYLVDTNNLTGYAQVVEEIQDSVVTRQYSYGLDLISQRQIIGNDRISSFYNYDGHGSVRGLTDSNGNLTDEYQFDSFGILVGSTGNTPNNYLYAGEQYDHDLGLYYNRARYLDVNRGRFWSQDSFEANNFEPSALHKYLYTANNPVNNIDPSGLITVATLSAGITFSSVLNSSAKLNILSLSSSSTDDADFMKELDKAFDRVRQILTKDTSSDCAKFFGPFALDALERLQKSLVFENNTKLGTANVPTGMSLGNFSSPNTDNLDGQRVPTFRVPGKALIYRNGPFFALASTSIDIKSQVGKIGIYEPGTASAQNLIILHELAHMLLDPRFIKLTTLLPSQLPFLIEEDRGNRAQSQKNNEAITEKCQNEIEKVQKPY